MVTKMVIIVELAKGSLWQKSAKIKESINRVKSKYQLNEANYHIPSDNLDKEKVNLL